MKILVKKGTVVNHDKIVEADVLIHNSRINRVAKGISEKADKVIDAKGKFVFPGFIDMHTHLRVPGREDEEDILSGSLAAVKGGFTKIFCMPNTEPVIDNEALVKWIIKEGEKAAIADVLPVGAITKARQGKELTEFGAMKKAGCLSLSDDGSSVADSLLFRRALEYAKMYGMLIISHCEDVSLSNKGAMLEGEISSRYGVAAIPDIAEGLIVARDITIAKYLNARIHLAHISTAKSIDIIRGAKKEKTQVSCETCPHYFILSSEDVEASGFNSNFKVNPPLAGKKDIEAVKQALKEGIIDCIATDHAPHSKAEKELPFENAPFGFIGLELAFSLVNKHLVKSGVLDLQGLVEKMAYNPARILGLELCGSIKEDYEADIAIVDLNKTWKVREENIVSKSKNTPFLEQELEGLVENTIHKGKIVYQAE